MKRKLLGLLGILTLISGCSNVNQRSIDPEAKKINLIKNANTSEEDFGDENTKVYTTSEGIEYALTWDENDKDYYVYLLEKEVDGITYTPYKYDLSTNSKIIVYDGLLLSSNSSIKRSLREFFNSSTDIIYLSKAEYNPNKLVYVKESSSYVGTTLKNYRHFKYDLSQYSDFSDFNSSNLTNFKDCKVEYSSGESLEVTKAKANSLLKTFFPSNLYDKLYVKNFNLEVLPSDVMNNPEVPAYITYNPTNCEKTFVVGEEEVEILPYDELITSKISSGTFILSKDFDCRDLLIRLGVDNFSSLDDFEVPRYGWGTFDGKLADPCDGIIGKINQIVIQKKTNTNEYMPYTMTINFDVIDKYSFEVAGTCQVVFYTVFFLEDIVYKFDNKELKKDDHINIGYGRKLKELYDIINHDTIRNYFSLIIDGKEYTNKSEELEKSFYELNLKSTSLLEIKLNNDLRIGPLFACGAKTACCLEGTPYISNVMELYLDFKDDINPVLSSQINSYRTFKEDNFKYKELFKAVDEKDNDVSDTIELLKEENKTYVTAKDKAGNVGKLEITLDVDPVLYENINVINDFIFEIPENVFITKNRVEKILAKIHSKEVKDLDMITYINNSKVKGEYKVTYKVEEENKELIFTVIDPIEEKVTPESFSDQANEFKDSFIGKIKTFFIKLGNWFRGVFTKWRFDCYIDSEEWDTRFN